jgi:hypothetical protein
MVDEFQPIEGYQSFVLNRYAGIAACRDHSREKLVKLRQIVQSYFDAHPSDGVLVSCVAVCGSLARLEASKHSDLDLITVAAGEADASTVHRRLLALVKEEMGVPLPNPKGVFANPSSTKILSRSSGDQEEDYKAVSQRILFVLESKWVWNKSGYEQNMSSVVDAYAAQVEGDRRKNYVFLLNDIIRYFRTICVNYQFNTEGSEWGKWPLRNVKLRHSRVLMYFSMVAALGELSTHYESDKKARLLGYIRLTPLERIFQIYQDKKDHSWFRFFGFYDTFLRILSDDKSRDLLNKLEYEDRYKSSEFASLKANSDGLAAEIVRFILDRRQQWSDRFLEYLLI